VASGAARQQLEQPLVGTARRAHDVEETRREQDQDEEKEYQCHVVLR
jgi:hypothetical protein